ncbi:MAG: trigger factor [Acidobacteriaceae bacterium]|nr:trigger factor [Acidobacteriaceae bacterium]MBV9779601.1 trigger factor [Acidobacteriaceae bacterium]
MPTAEDCKRSLEIEVPLEEVERAKERVTNSIKQRARLPGFRPGKAPTSLIESRFQSEIRSEVLDALLPQAFRDRVQKEDLKVVGTPDVSELHFEPGQPIRFKAVFEVAPVFDVGEYRGLPVKYQEPTVTDEEITKRLESMRESKAEYINLDPRLIENGDFVLVHLKSVSGLSEPIDQDVQIQVGAEDTLPAFTENLLGANPEEMKEFDLTYPEDYAQESLAGKTVRFELTPKVIRKKELPALDDEFARDLGDYQTLDELKDAVKKSIFHEKQYVAQQEAKEELIDQLVRQNDFPVPEAYVDRQIENQVKARLGDLAGRGVDPSTIKLDWQKVKESQQDKALKSVKASLLLEKISQRESIYATKDEVDREVQRIARQEREAVPVTRARLEKEGMLGRIADHIQAEKTLHFLFEQAQKRA